MLIEQFNFANLIPLNNILKHFPRTDLWFSSITNNENVGQVDILKFDIQVNIFT